MAPSNEQSNQPALSKQEKLRKTMDSVTTGNQNVNQNHNSKKVSLGPNTKR
jgi:hypothetical protein